jgi:hypothetical protein
MGANGATEDSQMTEADGQQQEVEVQQEEESNIQDVELFED